jgi:hypothetical protein
MKLPILVPPVARSKVSAPLALLLLEGVRPAALGTCYDNANCQTRGLFNQKGELCNNCTITQCHALGGQAWRGSIRMYGFGSDQPECWPMNAGLVQREQLGRT